MSPAADSTSRVALPDLGIEVTIDGVPSGWQQVLPQPLEMHFSSSSSGSSSSATGKANTAATNSPQSSSGEGRVAVFGPPGTTVVSSPAGIDLPATKKSPFVAVFIEVGGVTASQAEAFGGRTVAKDIDGVTVGVYGNLIEPSMLGRFAKNVSVTKSGGTK